MTVETIHAFNLLLMQQFGLTENQLHSVFFILLLDVMCIVYACWRLHKHKADGVSKGALAASCMLVALAWLSWAFVYFALSAAGSQIHILVGCLIIVGWGACICLPAGLYAERRAGIENAWFKKIGKRLKLR